MVGWIVLYMLVEIKAFISGSGRRGIGGGVVTDPLGAGV